jgi:multidrug transporter EmrE-like cation transporter
MWQFYLALGLSALASGLAQVLLKKGVKSFWADEAGLWANVLHGLGSGWIWAGVGVMAASLVLYLYSFGRIELSKAAPVATGLGVCVIAVMSHLWLHERIHTVHLIGFAVIVLGIWLVMRPEAPPPAPVPPVGQ